MCLAVGVIAISSQENARITNGSAVLNKTSGTHMVELEMFHQLHCLVRLYNEIFQSNFSWHLIRNGCEISSGNLMLRWQALDLFTTFPSGEITPVCWLFPDVNEYILTKYKTDHCIDYLRQTIMCHGEVTPITFEFIPEIHGLIAHHSTQHQCRDFEKIYNWAALRQVDGVHAGGNHVNVELKHPEKFD